MEIKGIMDSADREKSLQELEWELKEARERAEKARIRRQISEYNREANDPFYNRFGPTLACKINSLS